MKKSSISRQHIYLLIASLLLFIFVLIFSFGVLIPQGKEYRVKRVELKKVTQALREYQDFYDETLNKYKELQKKNRGIIIAFDRAFNSERFEKQHKKFFLDLVVSKIHRSSTETDKEFALYEVNTTSQMSSPKSFYDFLDAINRSDWIVGVNFPINFNREGNLIKSSFTMHVYAANQQENNATTE